MGADHRRMTFPLDRRQLLLGTAAALSPASGQNDPIGHGASPHAPTLSVARDPQAPQHSFRTGHAA